MGKRSDFKRLARDAYDTPAEAVEPLLRVLEPRTIFIEPCAGRGLLVEHLVRAGHILAGHYDLPDDARTKRYNQRAGQASAAQHGPSVEGACRNCEKGSAFWVSLTPAGGIFITNPPWTRSTLHPIIANLSDQAPAWLLFDADWVHTQQAIPYLPRLQTIISVGRVRWIPGSPYDGKDNCAWHLFSSRFLGQTVFIGREPR